MRSFSIVSSGAGPIALKTEGGSIIHVYTHGAVDPPTDSDPPIGPIIVATGVRNLAQGNVGQESNPPPIIVAPAYAGTPLTEMRTTVAAPGTPLENVVSSWDATHAEQRHLVLHHQASEPIDLKDVLDKLDAVDAHVTMIVTKRG